MPRTESIPQSELERGDGYVPLAEDEKQEKPKGKQVKAKVVEPPKPEKVMTSRTAKVK